MQNIEIKDKIHEWFSAHKEEYLSDLAKLVAIPSVETRPDGDKPYGKECAKALDTMLALCEKYGFEVKNFDYHAGTAVFEGKSSDIQLDILSHLDVVAAGTGWDSDPFALVQKDDFVYGRGVADDKGPALCALYAARCLKELGLVPEKSTKLIFGCAEETGSKDLLHYFKTEKSAPYTFTPDGCFPVYNGEKGRYCPSFSMSFEKETGARVASFECGNAPNIVPEVAKCSFAGIDEAELARIAGVLEGELCVKYEIDGSNVVCRGKSAHASLPHFGTNALTALVRLITSLTLCDCKSTRAFKSLDRLLPHGDTVGKNVGVYMKEQVSGEITLAFSMLHYDGMSLLGVCDLRLPFCATEENSKTVFDKALENEGFRVVGDLTKPHYTPNDSPFVQTLLSCYEFITGRKGETQVMGGGTYVHDIEGGVAFGPLFNDYDENEHGANERLKINDLLIAGEVYAYSILNVAK